MLVRKILANEVEKLSPLYYESEDFIQKRKDQINNGIIDIYVLEHDNLIIGEVSIIYSGMEDIYVKDKIKVYMEALRILPIYRNKGLGQLFLKEVINNIKNDGYKEITIGVADDNLNVKHIYNKLGFTEFLRREPEINMNLIVLMF